MWTVQEAMARFSEVLKRARDGEVQIIGAQEPCVVISMDEYERLKRLQAEPHLGKWLVETLKGLGDIELPSRGGDRPDPFADWTEEDFGI